MICSVFSNWCRRSQSLITQETFKLNRGAQKSDQICRHYVLSYVVFPVLVSRGRAQEIVLEVGYGLSAESQIPLTLLTARSVLSSVSEPFLACGTLRKRIIICGSQWWIHSNLLLSLMTFWKCIFNGILKDALACSTPEYRKWHTRVPRHPSWETLV